MINETCHATQVSILGPYFWNVAYDRLLRSEMLKETVLVGDAIDVAAFHCTHIELAHLNLNEVLRIVNAWMFDQGLPLTLSNSDITIFTKKSITVIPLRVGR